MNFRQSLVIGVSLVLCCLILGLFFGQPLVGQGIAIPARAARFQIMSLGKDHSVLVIFEPNTGQCWLRDTRADAKEWRDLGSPAIKTRK